jgi:hypothetical protein
LLVFLVVTDWARAAAKLILRVDLLARIRILFVVTGFVWVD